jgi:hypothetical protein
MIRMMAALAVAVVLLVAGAVGRSASGRAFRDGEVARLRAHFDSVQKEMLARDVSHLTPAQREARIRHLRALWLYRERGIFPRNTRHPDRAVPYFVDDSGVMCAMAHLIASSGRRDLVDRIARATNNAYIPELAHDPQLVAWLDSAGLTIEEAARVQPSYEWEKPPPVRATRSLDKGYAVASAISSALGAGAVVWNLQPLRSQSSSASRLRETLGLGAGVLGLALGISNWNDDPTPRALIVMNGAIGLTSTALAVRNLAHRRGPTRPEAGARQAFSEDGTRSLRGGTTIAVAFAAMRSDGGITPAVGMRLNF